MNKNKDSDYVMVEIGKKSNNVHNGQLGKKEYPGEYPGNFSTKPVVHNTNTFSLWSAIFGEAIQTANEKATYLENVEPQRIPAPLGQSVRLEDFELERQFR
tara:strand:- start:537 stop:839 length:303 start_codon:yes stop_codon:yes gene_type:complete